MLSRVSASAASAALNNARASAAFAARRAVSSSSASAAASGLLRRRAVAAAASAATATISVSPVSGLGIPTASAAGSDALSMQTRGFSSSSSVHFPNATPSIPTRHSRHLPRPVCTDPAELESTTSQLLASRPGSLFTYEFTTGSSSSSSSNNKADEYEAGLVRSDVTTQKFEWTLGGHAARIPGTVASANNNRKGDAADDSDDALKHLDAMVQLLERIEEEGRIYVELRARVLNQQYSDSNTAASSDSSDSSSSDSSSDSDSDSDTDTAAQSQSNSKSQSAWRIQSLINRYGAAPGPSVHMYDALLDAIACCAEAEADSEQKAKSKSSMGYLALARSVYERAMARHHADGGPNANNRLTMPTLITYNAVLRTCAAVEYQHDNSNEEVRDAALDLAFLVYDALNTNSNSKAGINANTTGTTTTTNSSILPQRNSATYVHMLRVIAKYLPPSSTRGNVAHGLWLSCTGHDGVLDDKVIQAYVEANTRNGSNGQQYDDLVAKLTTAGTENTNALQQENGNGVLRQNWWRNRKSRRMGINAEGY